MNHYLGVKLIQAEPMTRGVYNALRGWTVPADENPEDDGYRVVYPDGYQSWSPKAQFEEAYLCLGDDPSRIGDADCERFIHYAEASKLGEKTSLVFADLRNGFRIVESSSCVEPGNFDHEIGTSICFERINSKISWLLGFVLQWGRTGLKPEL